MRAISKRFGPVVANDHVDFEASWGEVHALVGENGAGKSTLMSILAGLYRPDSGQVEIDGKPVRFRSPRDAIAHGIGMVYQHFMLVEPFTVAENVVLGEQRTGVDLQTARVERELTELSAALRSRRRSAGKDLAALRRRAAAGRDPASALSRRADPRLRRADGRAHAAGGAESACRRCAAWRRRASASSSSRTSSTRCWRSPIASASCAGVRSSRRPRPLKPTAARWRG